MGRIVSISCPKCGGTGRVDDHYDSEKGEWVQKYCPHCSGSGTMNMYQNDDGTYSDGW